MDKLTEKQRLFVLEYLVELNATRAAKKAGYPKPEQQGHRLLKNVKVQQLIQKEQEARGKRLQITADMVLAELAKIGFADISNYMSWNDSGVNLKDSNELSSTHTGAVQEVSYHFGENSGNVKLKLHDKAKALEKIGQHLGMFKDNISLEIKNPDHAKVLELNGMKPRGSKK